eukprot:7382346-Alexandrium_andersonii.AAC.1
MGRLFLPRLISVEAYGRAQYAYTPGRGARDAILYFVLTWLMALASGHRVALYCSDVSGAFDKVDTQRLLGKLVSCGVHSKVVEVLRSWLAPRSATVVVKGASSRELAMTDM